MKPGPTACRWAGFLCALTLFLLLSRTPNAQAIDPEARFIEGLEAYDAGFLEDAADAFQSAAETGHLEAIVVLAGMTLEGTGVRRDAALAARLYRRAAQAGDALAQLNLGDLYARGIGVPRDLVTAMVWLSRAAAQGRRWPKQRLAQIVPLMSPEQRQEAERRLAK